VIQTCIEIADDVATGRVSPVELVEAALRAIEKVQPACNAFTAVLGEPALARARSLVEAPSMGPLHGVPVVVKDLYDIEGVRTSGCCAAYMERDPARANSVVVDRLLAAGAIVVAKTNQHELACGATTQISSFGPAHNPYDLERIPGGSSGGSAIAVATGVVSLAMGSDTGGSIRIPAAMCGVTGLKPTHGSVSLRGAMPMIPGFDSAGPLAVSAADCAMIFRLLAGYDDLDLLSREAPQRPASEDVSGLRIGLPGRMYKMVHTEVRVATEVAAHKFEELGAVLVELDGPDPEDAWAIWAARWADVADCFRDLWDDPRPSPAMQALLQIGRDQTGPDLARAQAMVRKVRRDFQRSLRDADVLLTPCVSYPAPRATDHEVEVEGGTRDVHAGGAVRLTSLVNLAGMPALAFPVGVSSEGLPLGAQLIGPEWSDEMLCAVGAVYQRVTDWHLRRAAGY
jgi:aspartyl-tRNA(Asn)/glutamyl-tRNA(Gln) amidotransferase subunit A